MGVDIASLGVVIDPTGAKHGAREVDHALNKIQRGAGTTIGSFDRLKKSIFSLKGVFISLGVGIAAAKILDVSVNFEKLKASLETVTGSTVAANAAFDRVRDFAATTPFAVSEVTEAFIKLKALGLDPSERSLQSYGNTASAMGKTLNQMIEAVADAATGEFERLKEFGIKARSQGDKVSFIFRGVTKTVKKEAKEIEGYLLSLGEVEFAGGMERQSKTIGGALSNLGDAWDTMLYGFAQTGPIKVATEAIRGLTDALEELTPFEVPIELNIAGLKLDRKRLEDAIAFGVAAKGTLINEATDSAIENLRERLKEVNKEIKSLEVGQVERIKLQFQEMEEAFQEALKPSAKAMVKDILGEFDDSTLKDIKKFTIQAERELNKELQRENKLLMEGMQLRKQVATPFEALNASVARYTELLNIGVISQQTFNRAVEEAREVFALTYEEMNEGLDEHLDKMVQMSDNLPYNKMVANWQDTTTKMSEMSANWHESTVDAFIDAAATGKLEWRSLIAEMLKEYAKLTMMQATTGGGGGGLFGTLLSGIGGLFGGGGGGGTMGAQSVASVFEAAFANGGVMTSKGPLPLNSYAGGGVATQPQVSIFGDGSTNEAYVPLPDGRSIPVTMRGSAESTSVNITQVFNVDARLSEEEVREKFSDAALEGASKGYSKVLDDIRRRHTIQRQIETTSK